MEICSHRREALNGHEGELRRVSQWAFCNMTTKSRAVWEWEYSAAVVHDPEWGLAWLSYRWGEWGEVEMLQGQGQKSLEGPAKGLSCYLEKDGSWKGACWIPKPRWSGSSSLHFDLARDEERDMKILKTDKHFGVKCEVMGNSNP